MEKLIEKIERSTEPLICSVEHDEIIRASEKLLIVRLMAPQNTTHGNSQLNYQPNLS
jgi:hypothetical protein